MGRKKGAAQRDAAPYLQQQLAVKGGSIGSVQRQRGRDVPNRVSSKPAPREHRTEQKSDRKSWKRGFAGRVLQHCHDAFPGKRYTVTVVVQATISPIGLFTKMNLFP
jgi:hypothetical protein